MVQRQIRDWNDAYGNAANIPGGERWPDAWVGQARAFRERQAAIGHAMVDVPYGRSARHRLDLFLPQGKPEGLVVFIHGGYWLALDKSYWSHLAAGPIARGFAVAMPSYTLCPDISIAGICQEIGTAVSHAAGMIEGPLYLSGHSAGGHLATRMISATSPLPESIRRRVRNTVSISGLHDLRPIMRTEMNAVLRIDEGEAARESPALLRPLDNIRLTCWVGASERAEFIRQSALLANVWTGLGAETDCVKEPDRHHFNVIDGLADPAHALTKALLAA
jgi:hypothetical protein